MSEAEFAKQLDVSRQPVRDAFFRLSKLGFLSIRPQRPTLITHAANFHAIDDAFHEVICMASGHSHVWALIQEQKAHLDRLRFLSLSQERQKFVIAEHRGILRAIEANDSAKAEDLLREHISAIETVLPRIVADHQDYFETQLN